jgi:hypothetical protein
MDAIEDLKKVRKERKTGKTVTVRIDDVDVQVEPDSGADENIMDEHQFKALIHRSKDHQTLKESRTKLSTLQNKLPVKGEFSTTVRNKTRGVSTKFIEVKGRINSPPLISKPTLTDLGMLQIEPDGSLGETNNLRILDDNQQVKTVTHKCKQKLMPTTAAIVTKYKQTFEGIGKIRDNKNNKELYAKFSIKPVLTTCCSTKAEIQKDTKRTIAAKYH